MHQEKLLLKVHCLNFNYLINTTAFIKDFNIFLTSIKIISYNEKNFLIFVDAYDINKIILIYLLC